MSRHVCQKGEKLRKSKCTNADSVKVADRPNMSYIFVKSNGTRTSETLFPSFLFANTQIQIHKNTNTLLFKDADRSNMCYIFEKGNGMRTSFTMFPSVWRANKNTQKQKFTNTQIHLVDRGVGVGVITHEAAYHRPSTVIFSSQLYRWPHSLSHPLNHSLSHCHWLKTLQESYHRVA